MAESGTPDRNGNAARAYAGLDRLFHERARLGIVTSLAGQPDGLPFSDLKRLCGLTDGNLNRHLQALSEAGFISVAKMPGPGRGTTICRLTLLGRERFLAYLGELERVLADARAAAGGEFSAGRTEPA